MSIRGTYIKSEKLFDKLDSFGIKCTSQQKLFENLAVFDFESICVQEESFKDTKTTTWIGKHVPISVSISSNLVEEPIFLYHSDPHHLVSSFIGTLEGLASQSKAQMKLLFLGLETTIKIKLGSILEKLTQRHNRREQADLDDCDNEICASTQILQIEKNQLIDRQESLERYCNVLPVFGFNSAKYDINLIKSYLLPILVNERDIAPTVIKKANQFISFKFVDIQLLHRMNFLGGATSPDSFLKSYKISESKGFFHYEWFDHPDKMQNTEFPQYDAFYSKLRSCNPLEADYTDYVNLLKSGLTTEQAVVKLKLSKPPPTGIENYLGRGCDQMTLDNFTADAVANFFPRTCFVKHKQHDKREPGLFKEEFRCMEMLCLCNTTYCCYDVTSNKLKFSRKGLNKRVLEERRRPNGKVS